GGGGRGGDSAGGGLRGVGAGEGDRRAVVERRGNLAGADAAGPGAVRLRLAGVGAAPGEGGVLADAAGGDRLRVLRVAAAHAEVVGAGDDRSARRHRGDDGAVVLLGADGDADDVRLPDLGGSRW